MALLTSFPTVDSGDSVQARLTALRGVPGSAADPEGPGIVQNPPAPPRRSDPGDGPAPLVTSRGGRLVRWWVPAPLREARWEPGRQAALILSVVAALAAVLTAVGVWWDRPVPEPAPVLPLVNGAAPAPSAPPPGPAREVVVSVLGRVPRPGLIRLAEGTRVADALDAVGGALPGTDLLGLNLARRLSDGEQLLVGIAPPPEQPASSQPANTPRELMAVDLNTASLEQLDGLPGIGRVTAQRILDWRTSHRRFTSVDQLGDVSGIGPARLAQLKHRVRV